jgi:peroxiredoxin
MMYSYKAFQRIVLFSALVGVVGCDVAPPSGVVGWRDPLDSNTYAPDFPILTSKNKEVHFHEAREPVTILVFVMATKPCNALNANISRISQRMKHLPATIVQMSLATEECSQASICCKSLPSSIKNVMCLSDASRIAWNAYKQPATNTLMLIDRQNKIIDVQPFGHSKALEDKAMAMALDIYDARFDCDD